jgi:hypothetical protein
MNVETYNDLLIRLREKGVVSDSNTVKLEPPPAPKEPEDPAVARRRRREYCVQKTAAWEALLACRRFFPWRELGAEQVRFYDEDEHYPPPGSLL